MLDGVEYIINMSDVNFTESGADQYYKKMSGEWLFLNQLTITQQRIENLDDIFQKQLIWSYGKSSIQAADAYFYWDWCPLGTGTLNDPKWQLEMWDPYPENKFRDIDRTFDFRKFKGYTNTRTADEMVQDYDARDDEHTKDDSSKANDFTTLDIETLRHNIMRSYIEVSEWLGDGAAQYGSHNGFVSRKMSMAWLFCAIRALINWKLANQDKWA